MLETSNMLGWFAAALLFAAIVAWLNLRRSPLLQRLNVRTALKSDRVESASRLLAIALGVSAVAAIVAVAGWMFG
jgi:hypothetical protein